MNIQKKEQRTKPITIRISNELHEQLKASADAQAWTVNEEINQRLRVGPLLEQLRMMNTEISNLKEIIRDLKGGS